MTPQQRWSKIHNFKFPPLFFEILCHRQQWDMAFAIEVVEEYKKFMYLATYSKVTPSIAIDEVWHLHIQWTSLYAEFCQDIFDYDFCHHSPEFVIPANGVSSFHHQYYETLKHYYWEFDCHPPSNIWSYNLRKGVKLKSNGRIAPRSIQTLPDNLSVLFSPVFISTVIKAKIKQYRNAEIIFTQQTNPEKKILQWQFPQGFENRLAKENQWGVTFATEAISAYLQFQISQVKKEVITISPTIEKVWLLHLLATKNYQYFSRNIFAVKIIPYSPSISSI